MKKSHYLIFFVLIFSFAACKKGTTIRKIIDNKSSDDLTVRLQMADLSTTEIILVPAKKKEIIFTQNYPDETVADDYDCTYDIESIEIEVSNNLSLSLSINPMNPGNWFRSIHSGAGRSVENCTFTVNDGDFR